MNNPRYEAPEIRDPEDSGDPERKKYDEKVDMYALGVILYELCTLKIPDKYENCRSLDLDDVLPPVKELGYTKAVTDLLTKCMSPDAGSRPTALQLIRESAELTAEMHKLIKAETFEKEFKECVDFAFRAEAQQA